MSIQEQYDEQFWILDIGYSFWIIWLNKRIHGDMIFTYYWISL